MRCKSCNYPLWQLNSRECPECGTPFKPSDFEFVPNSVRFCCPHCQQTYYGIGPRGHLEPFAFECVTCNRAITMDQTVTLPAEGVLDSQTQPGRNPWAERRQSSFLGAWFRTIGLAIGVPFRLAANTPSSSSGGTAFAFGYSVLLLYSLTGVVWLFAFPMVFLAGRSAGMGLGVIAGLVAAVIGLAVLLFLLILVVHGALRLTGSAERGLRGTAQAVCYSAAVNVPMAVPCVSFYVAWLGWIWWAIAAGFMLVAIHRIRSWRAVVAVSVPVAMVVLSVAGLVTFAVLQGQRAGAAAAVAAQSAAQTLGVQSTTRVVQVLAASASQEGYPQHIAEVVSGGSPVNLLAYDAAPDRDRRVLIGGVSLDRFLSMPQELQSAVAQSAAAELPPDAVAYRVGDYVFTYPGIAPSMSQGAGASLWLVVYWPLGLAKTDTTSGLVCIGEAGGVVRAQVAQGFDSALAAQNTLRVKFGLRAIPHPADLSENQVHTGGAEQIPPVESP